MTTYYMVQGDTGSQVRVTIRRNYDNEPQDVSEAEVRMYFREKGTKTLKSTLYSVSDVESRQNGVVIFVFAEGDLDIDPGFYEGEIEVRYNNGGIETVYQTLNFYLREDFA